MNEQEISRLNIRDLKQRLKQLGLPTTGNKKELQKRLILHLAPHSDESENSVIQCEPTNVNHPENQNYFAHLNSESNEVSEIQTLPRVISTSRVQEVASFTFKDIEESLTIFTGEKNQSVKKWIEEFDDVSLLVNWNSLQKYIYAKRLINGSAKLFVNSLNNIRDWETLKSALLKEFGALISSAEIHRKLRNRRKQYSETLREYLYKMMEIASPINLDEESLIEYIIDGIKDDKINKIVLYEAKTIEELKNRFRIYEKLKDSQESHREYRQFKSATNMDKRGKQKSCFKCGDNSHLSNSCPSKVKDYKCFKCNNYGHRSFECKMQTAQNTKVKLEPTANFAYNRNNMMKFISLNGEVVQALVDTGCDLTICRQDFFNRLNDVNLIPTTIMLNGLGNHEVATMGFFKTKLEVDDDQFDITCHVIPEKDTQFTVIIGNDLLQQATLLVDQEGIHFTRKASNSKLSSVSEFQSVSPDKISELRSEFKSICCLAEIGKSLESVTKVNLNHLPINVRVEAIDLIESYKPQQKVDSPIEMSIILKDETPIYERPRRMSADDKNEIELQINNWLQNGIIQPSNSEFACPVVLVSKRDGTKRLCCDFRKLNQQILKDHFPMPLIDDVLDQLQKAKIFTTLDLVNGFFHVPIAENCRKYTSFIVHNGQYEFLRVPFGICNSPSVFTRFISVIFRDLVKEGILLTYMDDLLIPARKHDEALARLEKVLEVASNNGLKIKWEKSQIMQNKIDFLGYIIENGTIRPSLEKTKAVVHFPLPQDKVSLQRFLGLTSYFRKFIANYSILAKPLSDLLRKNVIFKMGLEQGNAFEILKEVLASSPVLNLFDQNAYTEIHADASKEGYGAILLQRNNDDQQLHPVQYMSRKTNQAEQRYHSYELEVLAIVQALKKWRIYVLGKKIKIVTDCNAFALTIKKKDVPLRVARWAMFLQDFNYEIEHRSGTKMRHVDALSRVAMPIIATTTHRIRQAQLEDDYLKAIRKILEVSEYEGFYIKNDVLFKDVTKELIVIPRLMEEDVIKSVHRQGHFSSTKTEELIKKNYFIPELKRKVPQVVKNCIECIMSERKTGKQEGFLAPIDKGDRPLQTFHIDHIGPMEETKKKYNHIFVVVDAFSKFVWLYPTKSTTSEEVVDRLKKQSSIFGNPKRVISDRGTAFTSKLFKEYCEKESIQHLLITTGVPRGNGQVERLNRVLISLLTKMSIEEPQNWYKHVDRAQQIINNTPTRSTKFAPFKILTGMDMRVKDDLDLQTVLDEDNLNEVQKEQDNVRQESKRNIAKIQKENYRGFNKKRKISHVYKVNDLVAVKRTQFGAGLKLKPKFLGPYKIAECLKHDRYSIEKVGDHEGPRLTTASADGLKKWGSSFGPNDPSGGPIVGSETRKLRSGNTEIKFKHSPFLTESVV